MYFTLFIQATSPEELSVMDGEEIEFLETQGDGWCKARSKSGQVGFVPESYIEIKSRASTLNNDATSNSPSSSLAGSMASDAFPIDECQTPTSVASAPFTSIDYQISEPKAVPNYGTRFKLIYCLQ